MNDFKVIYKILKTLHGAMSCEELDPARLSAARLGVDEPRLESLLILLAKAGYIDGRIVTKTLSGGKEEIVLLINPRITLRGLEYLAENPILKKVAEASKGMSDIAF